jgi:hypothetical protein
MTNATRLPEGFMGTLIIAASLIGFLLLLSATVALVVLNWSEKTLAPVLSILLVGTATTLAAVLVTLKESSIESVFTTSIVIDENAGAPLFVIVDSANPKLTSRLSDLVLLGRPTINRDGKAVLTMDRPIDDGQRFKFCGELLQYQVLTLIQKLQRGGWKAGQTLGASIAETRKPLRRPSDEDYPKDKLLAIIAENRFSNSEMEQFHWKNVSLPLPKRTTLSLGYVPPSAGGEKHVLSLRKAMFFEIEIEFVIEPLAGTGPWDSSCGATREP